MESNFKRRKLDHNGSQPARLIDFQSRDTARVSTASTFVLQTDELVKEARLDYGKALKPVDGLLHKLKGLVESIPSHGPSPISEATAKFEKKHRIIIPYPEPRPEPDAPYKLSFEKPASCNVVGSYVSQTMIKSQSHYGVDMVVLMPPSLFQEKDYQNMRYFYRRAYYIACITASVRQQLSEEVDTSFECLNENPLLPVLALRLRPSKDETSGSDKNKKKRAQQVLIRLIPCAPEEAVPRQKLTPSFNCNKTAETDEKRASHGTPFYNSTLKAETSFIHYLRVLTQARKECPALPEACLLGRTWLQQRGFGSDISQGGFGHFEWSIMIALLLKSGGRKGQAALSTSLSGPELFKAAIQFLSSTDFTRKPLILGANGGDQASVKESGPVMYDSLRSLNVLYKMTAWSANLLQFHAKCTTDLLADETVDSFEPTFIVKADAPSQMFDVLFEISLVQSPKLLSCDCRGPAFDFSAELHRLLKRAYANRASLVHVQQPERPSWAVSSSPSKQPAKVLVGVIVDFPHMSRQMEHGPSAEEQKEAARFRAFWGDKAELRRFKDGSILECVEWKSKLPFDLCQEISQYVLNRHLGVQENDIVPYGKVLTSILPLSNVDKAAFDSSRKAFQALEYDIRNLEDLPLQVRQLAMVSPKARYASITPPSFAYHTGSIEPLDVNIYFEQSSKWPENLTAIQEAKIEFLLDIDRRLTTTNKNITTYLLRENRDVGIENLAFLDIFYDSGASFRVRVHCDLEETILERQVQNKTLDGYVREEADRLLSKFQWQFTTLPLHTQTIATHCTRLHPLSPTIRLVKHWFNSHKLSGHFSEELIELLVLHAFLQPYPWRMPTSPSTGFLRTLLLLSRWDWRDHPLVLDTAESLTAEDYLSIRKKLASWRQRDPNMSRLVLFVATSGDTSGHGYTLDGPSKLVASRMTTLAKAAYKLVKADSYRLDASALFQSSLQDYDVLIHLSPRAIRSIVNAASTSSNGSGAIRPPSQFKNLAVGTGSTPLPMRAHPVDVLMEELARVYEDTLMFFQGGKEDPNNEGDHVIAAIWNPRLGKGQKFRVGLPYNFISVDGNDEENAGEEGDDIVEVNKRAVLAEIARIGGEMIRRIEEV